MPHKANNVLPISSADPMAAVKRVWAICALAICGTMAPTDACAFIAEEVGSFDGSPRVVMRSTSGRLLGLPAGGLEK